MLVSVPAFLGWVLVRVSGLLGIDVVLARFICARVFGWRGRLSGILFWWVLVGVSAFLGIADIGVGDVVVGVGWRVVLAPFLWVWVWVGVSAFLGVADIRAVRFVRH